MSRRRNCDTILSGCPVTARAHREAPRRSRRPKREAAQHVRATHSATRPDARRPTASGRRGVDATKRRGGGRPKHLGSRSVDAVTMRPCLALLLVTAVRAVRHGDVMRPWSPPRPPRQSAVCARPPRPKNCVRLRHGWARRPPPRRAGRPPLAALAAAANATDRYNDDCRTCFLGNGTQLYEPKYRNFPLRWSSKVGVWKLTEADIEAQVQLMRQTEGNKGARNTRGALTGCREECGRGVLGTVPSMMCAGRRDGVAIDATRLHAGCAAPKKNQTATMIR